jgi:hypothetical protein
VGAWAHSHEKAKRGGVQLTERCGRQGHEAGGRGRAVDRAGARRAEQRKGGILARGHGRKDWPAG